MDITLTHIPREEVLRYLGCPGTEDPATLALVEGCSARLLAAARRVGLCATDRHILTPRKSVTAVLGISDGEISPQKRGCASCTFRDRCKFQCKESI